MMKSLASSEEKIFSLLGFARRARKIVIGHTGTELSVKRKQARLVVVADDASTNTVEHFSRLCASSGVKLVRFGSKDSLGERFSRQRVSVLGLLTHQFSNAILQHLSDGDDHPLRHAR